MCTDSNKEQETLKSTLQNKVYILEKDLELKTETAVKIKEELA